MADYDKVLQIDPKFVIALYNRGILKQGDFFRDFEGAMADYDKALQLDPNLFNKCSRNLKIVI